jgi:hypothetical protein
MENKSKAKNNKKLLSYLVAGLAIVCVVFLVTEIAINTMAELDANQSNEGYAVVIEYDVDGHMLEREDKPTPAATEEVELPSRFNISTPTNDMNGN